MPKGMDLFLPIFNSIEFGIMAINNFSIINKKVLKIMYKLTDSIYRARKLSKVEGKPRIASE